MVRDVSMIQRLGRSVMVKKDSYATLFTAGSMLSMTGSRISRAVLMALWLLWSFTAALWSRNASESRLDRAKIRQS